MCKNFDTGKPTIQRQNVQENCKFRTCQEYVYKKCFEWQYKNKIQFRKLAAFSLQFQKFFLITRTIFSHSGINKIPLFVRSASKILTLKSWNILLLDYCLPARLSHLELERIHYKLALGNQTLGYPSYAWKKSDKFRIIWKNVKYYKGSLATVHIIAIHTT